MSKKQKLLVQMVSNQKNVRFDDLMLLATHLGFNLERVSGSHHHLRHHTLSIKLNLQSAQGQAKPYQVRQLLVMIEMHQLRMEDES
ncbi:MAG: type II toxin-antitoxin system HicA family toxin [Pleurocapsa sp. SU_196_0]|nr:type II toxin-antitoxin system HicA family toxin [Pleurocapsa sp. SU_196_0]